MISRPPYFLAGGRPFRLSAVVFDFDGTLTAPGALDFEAIRSAVGCPSGIGLLEHLESLDDAEERARKEAVLEAAEIAAAERVFPNEGAAELVSFLRSSRVPMAIISRNRREPVERSFAFLPGIEQSDFVLIVTRDQGLSPKPLPDGVLHVAATMGLDPAEVLLIGDHAYDIEAGRRAGTLTMYLHNDPQEPGELDQADFVVPELRTAIEVIRYGLPLPTGKLPGMLLEESLGGLDASDPSVIVGARLGEDAAAVEVAEDAIVVLASDPITLAADAVARYAVSVNANDIATSGALPRWFLTTLLFPPGSSGSEVAGLIRDLHMNCRREGIELCGGHTEITDAVSRPLVVGTMAGTVPRSRLLDKRGMREGDRILFTKRVAVEGTGLLAREYAGRLLEAGLTAKEIEVCSDLLEHISILPEARAALVFNGVTALHDVTEGGLATAVTELGAAGERRLRLDMDRIPVYPETERVCRLLGLDPLGLIGSGSLLITCSSAQADDVVAAIEAKDIEVAFIGEVLEEGRGVEAWRGDELVGWPYFERDEVSRLGH